MSTISLKKLGFNKKPYSHVELKRKYIRTVKYWSMIFGFRPTLSINNLRKSEYNMIRKRIVTIQSFVITRLIDANASKIRLLEGENVETSIDIDFSIQSRSGEFDLLSDIINFKD